MRLFLGGAALLAAAVSSAAHSRTPIAVVQPYAGAEARDGAQLRSNLSVVIPILFHPCGRGEAFGPVMARYEAVKSEVSGTANAVDFAIAKADHDYAMSLIDISCPDLTEAEQSEYDSFEIAVASSVLDRIERLVRDTMGKDN